MKKYILPFVILILFSCKKENDFRKPTVILNTGYQYVKPNSKIQTGASMKFGIIAAGIDGTLTNIKITKITKIDTIVQFDKGVWIGGNGIDTFFTFSKSSADYETWIFSVMNSNRDTASTRIKVLKAEGSVYGVINYYPSITLGLQNNTNPHFLNLISGQIYDNSNISGHEQEIDLTAIYYFTSGKPSPTLTCPGYTSIVGYYPEILNWTVKNNIQYDYYSADNLLISSKTFDLATNDSTLTASFRPQNISGWCKYCDTGKVIPFKTAAGKYGLVKIIKADQIESGTIEIAIKIQQ